ncbi:MAG: DUF2796 domain-containing protein [bacterium]|nr:DUF2796 domain-containing protein [bacterium]
MNRILKSFVGLLSMAIYALSISCVINAEEYRQHGTHEHGLAQMNLAVDDKDLHIEVISPAANVVGFEHQPKTPEQEAAVNKAIDTLQDGTSLFGLTSKAACRLVEAQVDTGMINASDHKHDETQNEVSSEHEQHEQNGHDNDKEYDHEGHSEFTVSYHFTCRKPKKLQEIEVKLFSVFPGMERIQVHALTDNGQLAVELNPKQARIKL